MADKSLQGAITRKWIAVANLLAEEPFAPTPDQAGDEIRQRVAARFVSEKIPFEATPTTDPGFRESLTRDLQGVPFKIAGAPFNIDRGKAVRKLPGAGTVLLIGPDPRIAYDFAYSVAAVLGEITNAFSQHAEKLAKDGVIYIHLPRRFVRQMATIGAGGRIQIAASDLFGRFLREIEAVDVRRVRRCAACPRFFFAARTDQAACSRAHARTLAMRKWRAGKGHDYDQQRKIREYFEQEGKRPVPQRRPQKGRKRK